MRYAVNSSGATLGVDTTVLLDPVIAVIYGQAGLIVGATLEGTRYTRILPLRSTWPRTACICRVAG